MMPLGKLKEKRGRISALEMIVIIVLVAEALFLGYKGITWYIDSMAKGDDALMVNTAESVARINSNNGMNCVVNKCASNSNGQCPHQWGEGYVGYFDNVSNTIVESKPPGYNQAKVMTVGDQEYYGEINTMVIRVYVKPNHIELSWVLGKVQ